MKNETSDRQGPKEDVDEVVQQNLIRTFKRISKFQTCTEIEIRVYQGSKGFGNQLIPFHQACDIIQTISTIRIYTLDCSEVNDFKLTEDDIINWLLASIMKLHDHPGFPVGDNLQCPVFTQDKYNYCQS